MAAAEIINDFEKAQDREIELQYHAEPVESLSNKGQESDIEIAKPVEMSLESETIPNSRCNKDSINKDIPPNAVINETLFNGEVGSKSNEDEWLDIMGSGNFKKKVLKPGLGHETRPSRGDMVTVNYKIYLNDSLIEEKENLKFIVGDLDVIQGIDLVVCLMEKQEKAKVLIPSKLAFGKLGRPPSVPADANIECDVELKDVEDPNYDLTVTERLKFGNEKRLRGNYFYERGEYLESIHCYERAIEYLDGVRDCSNSSKEESQEIVNIRIKVYNNMAASHLKLSAYDSALSSVELVLKVQPQNVKALFRKAKILGEKGSTDEALSCIKIAARLEPNTKVIQTELTKLINKKKKEEQSQKAMYQRMFPKSEPKKSSAKVYKWSMLAGGGVLALAVGIAAYRHIHTRFFNLFY
ncbi:hypothetical protein JTE90_009918 [Oedothorax gibbosus]|uniref:peptidylprolyl isomerase n=1 Tax=Oedothorax gibbosus TaxID=931172 RepID=A0AAV6UV95_9ARAC|nr:hypothetical protein JTE90_009918 [Oedothorax gibbosus]